MEQDKMNIQWYPGHMTKAKRAMKEDMKLVDLVIELTDARVPQSGRNPDIDELAKNKARVILLNKSDLADEKANREWIASFQKQGILAVAADARQRGFRKQMMEAIKTSGMPTLSFTAYAVQSDNVADEVTAWEIINK